MMKRILFLAIIACMVGCSIIPTPYTTTVAQKNLARANTGLQVELFNRHDTMDAEILKQFLRENIKYAIVMEEVICGNVSETSRKFLQTLGSE
jgi:hypothetical protein